MVYSTLQIVMNTYLYVCKNIHVDILRCRLELVQSIFNITYVYMVVDLNCFIPECPSSRLKS